VAYLDAVFFSVSDYDLVYNWNYSHWLLEQFYIYHHLYLRDLPL